MIKKISLCSLILVFVLLLVASILNVSKSKDYKKALSINNVNSFVTSGNEHKQLSLLLYFTEENKYNLKKTIDCFQITDHDEFQRISLEVLDVVKIKTKRYVDKIPYYPFCFSLQTDFTRNDFHLNEAYVKITAKGTSIKLGIGSFSLSYYPSVGKDSTITIKSLSGRETYDPFPTLKVLEMTISNKTTDTININRISIDDEVLLNAECLNEISDNYSIMGLYCNDDLDILISPRGSTSIEIPLKYLKHRTFVQGYIKIDYSIGDFNYVYYQDNFCFFNTDYNIPGLKEVINIYDIN